MTELEVVGNTSYPITKDLLLKDLKRIGVEKDMLIMVQSSLTAIGWVCGGPVTVIDAMMESVGENGTIVMPTMSGDYTDPSHWKNPPVPKEWWETIRETMPPFDKEKSPTRKTGIITETFRSYPNVLRSGHPFAFSAWGRYAETITSYQPMSFPLGNDSPMDRCCELGGYGLLIGTKRNSILHLSEHRARFKKDTRTNGTPIFENGKRVWKKYLEYLDYTDHFPRILDDFLKNGKGNFGKIGNADTYFFKQRELVDFGIDWFESKLGE